MITINFINEYKNNYDEYQEIYLELAKKTIDVLSLDINYEMSVTLVDNQTIQEINRDYRFKDYATDVISFENDSLDLFDDTKDLGDIFISVDKAIEQARQYNHSLNRELSFLFIHGLLHCLGYNHETHLEEEEMFKLQEVILDALKQTNI